MKKSIIIALACIISIVSYSQEQTFKREIGAFSGIKTSRGISVEVAEGNSSTVEIITNPEVLDYVVTEVKGGILQVTFKDNINRLKRRQSRATVKVKTNNLLSVSASSGSRIKSTTKLHTKELKAEVSSAGSINIDLEAEAVSGNGSSGANINLTGKAKILNINMSSGASANMKDFIVETVSISTSSGANATVYAKEKITARASSGSNISYYGVPEKVDKSQNSGGSIKAK